MAVAAAQGSPFFSRLLTEELNENLARARPGESNTEFLKRFIDFHAASAGLVRGQQQSQTAIDSAYRASFLLAQLSSAGDVRSLSRIAEACVVVFKSGS